MKKALVLLLAFVLCISDVSFNLVGVSAYASPGAGTESVVLSEASSGESSEADFNFDSSSGTIKGYTGSAAEVIIPESIGTVTVRAIGKSAFAKKTVKSIVLNEGMELIGESAFANCKELESITFASTVESIEKSAFTNTKLETVALNEGLESIGQGAFAGCKSLKELIFPSSLKRIEQMAFANSSIEKINLNEGLTFIGQRAFFNCKAIKELSLPDSLEYLSNLAFEKTSIAEDNGIIIGTKMKHVGHSILKDSSPHIKISIAEGTGEKLYLHDDLFPVSQKELDIPQGREVVVFGRAFLAAKASQEVKLNCGELEIEGGLSKEEIEAKLNEKISLYSGFALINKNQSDGSQDIIIESDIDWDLDSVSIADGIEIQGTFKDIESDKYKAASSDYSDVDEESTESAMSYLKPYVRLKVSTAAAEPWNSEDFTYTTVEEKLISKNEYFAINGFSDEGLEKLNNNKNLELPERVIVDGSETIVEGVANNAFSGKGIETLKINVAEGYKEYIIDDNAFMNNEISSLELDKGVKFIEAYAFKDNKLTELNISETVVKLGNESFANNLISKLEVSDQVNNFQFDSFSFTNNKIKEVELPYSVFKLLQNVFVNNTGLEDGKVVIRTRNKAHLGTSTYIQPNSAYHKFILISDVDRTALHNIILKAINLDAKRYTELSFNKLEALLSEAKQVQASHTSTQDDIDAQVEKLQKAIDELEVDATDKTELIGNYERLKLLNHNMYTAESFAVLTVALSEAKQVIDKASVTAAELQDALQGLISAENQLVVNEAAKYKAEDFIYDNAIVKGFSESGKLKFKYNKDLVIPSISDTGIAINEIADKAFIYSEGDYIYKTDEGYAPQGLDSLVIPEGIKKIGNEAFRQHKIKGLSLPADLESIGSMCFNGNQIKEVSLPDTVTYIGDGAFSLNDISKFKFSGSMDHIPNGILSRNLKLKQIDIPDNVHTIGESAFLGCPLGELKLPSGLKRIKKMAFMSHRVPVLDIPASVEVIEDSAFASNKKFRYVRQVKLKEGLKEIHANAFKSGLVEEIHIPKSLEILAANAFNDTMNASKEIVKTKVYTKNKAHLSLPQDDSYIVILQEESTGISASGSSSVSQVSRTIKRAAVKKENSVPEYIYSGSWESEGNAWKLKLSDNTYAKDTWAKLNDKWYRFGADELMLSKWFKDDDKHWYFMDPVNGDMYTGWKLIDGYWYYMSEQSSEKYPQGALYVNTTTPDGYKVDALGRWQQ